MNLRCFAERVLFGLGGKEHGSRSRSYLRRWGDGNELTHRLERDHPTELLLIIIVGGRLDVRGPNTALEAAHLALSCFMIRNEIPGLLYASSRPGYDFGVNDPVQLEKVAAWMNEVRDIGIRSVLCLLDERHLCLYESVPGGLLEAYAAAGFEVGHVPVTDHENPPLTAEELAQVTVEFERLPKPVLIHCSAGLDRTGAAVRHLKRLSALSS